jgi:hypothetical protein
MCYNITLMPKYLYTIIMFSCIALSAAPQAFALKVGNANIVSAVTVRESYDDNITFAPNNEKADSVTRFGYGIVSALEGKKSNLSFSGNINYDLFARYNNYDNFSQSVSVGGDYEISPYSRVNFSDSFNHAQEPRSLDDAFGSNNGRYSYYQNGFTAAYYRDLSAHLVWGINYNNGLYTYTRDDLSDSYTNGGGTSLEYIFSSRTAASIYYDFLRRDFDPGTSSSTHSATMGFRHNITEQLTFNGKVGANFLDSYGNKRYAKPSFSLSLDQALSDRMNAGLSFSKNYSTTSYSQDIFNSWRLSARISRQLLAKLRVNASAFYGRGRYEESNIKDSLYGGEGGLGYEWSDNTTLSLNYNHSRTASNRPSREYTRNNVSMGAKVLF